MREILLKYLPEASLPLVLKWFEKHKFHLKIAKSRRTKLGDFRPINSRHPHRISVNGDLNPYHFLITLTHEVAHLIVWDKHQNRIQPHGKEWQTAYGNLLKKVIELVPFPKEVEAQIIQHIARPKASSCSDPQLYKCLKKYDESSEKLTYLEELNEGDIFSLQNIRIFKRGKKKRSRFECLDQQNGKTYLISGHASVKVLS